MNALFMISLFETTTTVITFVPSNLRNAEIGQYAWSCHA